MTERGRARLEAAGLDKHVKGAGDPPRGTYATVTYSYLCTYVHSMAVIL